ncbi:lipocalin family protein [Schlegelella aquatica]|uniref:lipocalin family protein n=1 Tax=Caldimonas aquatica TaxID=376175 RepID=UPI003751956C
MTPAPTSPFPALSIVRNGPARRARRARVALAAAALALSPGLALTADAPPLQPVPRVDLQRYAGLWYQVALYPNDFQSHCVSDTTATYTPRADGTIEVLNQCRRSNGEPDRAEGVARHASKAPGGVEGSVLEVRFAPAWLAWLPWVWGDYWVIQLADDYRYAVVSEPSRKYLWVLSRSPALSPDDDATIRTRLREQGFDLSRLQVHPQERPLNQRPTASP